MKNFVKKSKNNKGFSLIELLVVIVIAGIVITSASSLFVSAFNYFTQNKEKAENQRELRFITNYISENIKFSNDVSIKSSTSTPPSGYKGIGLDNNYVKIFNSDGTSRKLSNIIIDNLTFDPSGKSLDVEIEKNNYSIDTKVYLNNHKLSGTTSGIFIEFEE
ncbi:MAG TPA: prepilin-type N-terminal cleavage/methylation domain-containing protein [Halanaerobiales bacterium]|nr:prepilin-type N-terminal cleavage/methylation domain-containing protein [Halanaerobiales bacterium]